jgi:cytochrome c-type biogenesis protein CcmH
VTWVLAIALALAAFADGVGAFRIGRNGWTTFAAALALGLAGYALQASPGVPGAPASASRDSEDGAWAQVDERKAMVGSDARSYNDKVLVADGLARHGQYANAATMLRAAVSDNPRDAEAWLALGNALVEHADGSLTEPALLAYRRAEELDARGVGPGYFLGLALIRQGQLGQAREIWAETLQKAAPDATGRELLRERLARLDALLRGEGPIAVPR